MWIFRSQKFRFCKLECGYGIFLGTYFLDRSYFNNKVRSGIIAFFTSFRDMKNKSYFLTFNFLYKWNRKLFSRKNEKKVHLQKGSYVFSLYFKRIYINFYNLKNLHLRSSDYPILTPSLYKCQIIGHCIGHHSD